MNHTLCKCTYILSSQYNYPDGHEPTGKSRGLVPLEGLAGGPSTNQTGGPDCYPVLYLLSFKSLPKREKDLYFHFVCCTCGNKIATLIWDTCENSKNDHP